MKQLVKAVLNKVAPRWMTAVLSARSRAHSHRLISELGNSQITQKLIQKFGDKVQEGPFAGLVLTPSAHAEQFGPYLLGVYESELDEAWAAVFQGTYSQIVDIGAKIGYYSVGLAKRYPAVPVIAFDTDWWSRKAVKEMAAANETGNVEVEGFCSAEWLKANLRAGAFILSDCEGYEDTLFGSGLSPQLRTATLIIETHDGFAPGVTDKLLKAFEETHQVKLYDHDSKQRVSTRSLDDFSAVERQLASQQIRGTTRWLLCLPRTQVN